MSTILRALEKQKKEQAAPVATSSEKLLVSIKWKAALLVSLMVIVTLLLVVIYLLLKPANVFKSTEVASSSFAEQKNINTQDNKIAKTKSNSIEKISFELQPLPAAEPQLLLHSSTLNNENIVKVDGEEELQTVLTVTAKPAQKNKIEMDYSDTSTDLQLRFQQALLMKSEEDNIPLEEESGASDIHQMSSEFQAQLPSFSYDSHLYSSIAKDRWIRINREDLKEGEFDSSGKIQVVEIQPNQTIFRLGRQSFSVQSLTDWKGY